MSFYSTGFYLLTENSIEAYDRWIILGFVGGRKPGKIVLERMEDVAR